MGKKRATIHSMEGLEALYHFYNEEYFGGELPPPNLKFVKDLRHNNGTRARLDGACEKENGEYTISIREGCDPRTIRIALLHEMLHIRLWPKSHKSKAWKESIKQFAAQGFLEQIF